MHLPKQPALSTRWGPGPVCPAQETASATYTHSNLCQPTALMVPCFVLFPLIGCEHLEASRYISLMVMTPGYSSAPGRVGTQETYIK